MIAQAVDFVKTVSLQLILQIYSLDIKFVL